MVVSVRVGELRSSSTLSSRVHRMCDQVHTMSSHLHTLGGCYIPTCVVVTTGVLQESLYKQSLLCTVCCVSDVCERYEVCDLETGCLCSFFPPDFNVDYIAIRMSSSV